MVGGPPIYSFSLCEELSRANVEVVLLTEAYEELRKFCQDCYFFKIP
jgi:hypothetical protein